MPLSEYEQLRLDRIKRNEERLKELGLFDKSWIPKKKKRIVTTPKKKKQVVKFVRRSPRNSPRATRSSSRQLSDKKNEEDNLPDIDEIEEKLNNRRPRPRRQLNFDPQKYKLSEEDQKSLAGSADENFLAKFQEFLVYENRISESNERNVMRQVRKLASGEGIRYESPRYGWPEGCYFQKGIKITPMSDFVDLLIKGQEAEDTYGRDHGNGWLLSHPLKKLLLFQQFILENPDFLTSKLQLKEFCEDD